MGINTTIRQINIAAAKDLAVKLRFENIFAKKLLKLFREIGKELEAEYKRSNGGIISANKYAALIQELLQRHYTDVSDKFKNTIRAELGKHTNPIDINERVNVAVNNINNQNIADSTASIVNTTDNDIAQAVKNATVALGVLGLPLTIDSVAKRAKLSFDQLSRARIDTISTTETEGAAESAKYTEADVLNNSNVAFDALNNEQFAATKKNKMWVAILDEKTRPWHAAADGQVVDIDQPYIVNGEQLRYPRDMSLGASLDNVINCRCSSITIIY